MAAPPGVRWDIVKVLNEYPTLPEGVILDSNVLMDLPNSKLDDSPLNLPRVIAEVVPIEENLVCLEGIRSHVDPSLKFWKDPRTNFIKLLVKDDGEVNTSNVQVEQSKEDIANCRHRMVVISVQLLYDPGSKHANAIVVDKKKRTVEHFEPESTVNPRAGSMSPMVESTLKSLFERITPGYRFIHATEVCPSTMGPQRSMHMQGKQDRRCFSWSLMYMVTRVADPDMDVRDTWRYLLGIPENEDTPLERRERAMILDTRISRFMAMFHLLTGWPLVQSTPAVDAGGIHRWLPHEMEEDKAPSKWRKVRLMTLFPRPLSADEPMPDAPIIEPVRLIQKEQPQPASPPEPRIMPKRGKKGKAAADVQPMDLVLTQPGLKVETPITRSKGKKRAYVKKGTPKGRQTKTVGFKTPALRKKGNIHTVAWPVKRTLFLHYVTDEDMLKRDYEAGDRGEYPKVPAERRAHFKQAREERIQLDQADIADTIKDYLSLRASSQDYAADDLQARYGFKEPIAGYYVQFEDTAKGGGVSPFG